MKKLVGLFAVLFAIVVLLSFTYNTASATPRGGPVPGIPDGCVLTKVVTPSQSIVGVEGTTTCGMQVQLSSGIWVDLSYPSGPPPYNTAAAGVLENGVSWSYKWLEGPGNDAPYPWFAVNVSKTGMTIMAYQALDLAEQLTPDPVYREIGAHRLFLPVAIYDLPIYSDPCPPGWCNGQ